MERQRLCGTLSQGVHAQLRAIGSWQATAVKSKSSAEHGTVYHEKIATSAYGSAKRYAQRPPSSRIHPLKHSPQNLRGSSASNARVMALRTCITNPCLLAYGQRHGEQQTQARPADEVGLPASFHVCSLIEASRFCHLRVRLLVAAGWAESIIWARSVLCYRHVPLQWLRCTLFVRVNPHSLQRWSE